MLFGKHRCDTDVVGSGPAGRQQADIGRAGAGMRASATLVSAISAQPAVRRPRWFPR